MSFRKGCDRRRRKRRAHLDPDARSKQLQNDNDKVSTSSRRRRLELSLHRKRVIVVGRVLEEKGRQESAKEAMERTEGDRNGRGAPEP